jgi:hypothetical protein
VHLASYQCKFALGPADGLDCTGCAVDCFGFSAGDFGMKHFWLLVLLLAPVVALGQVPEVAGKKLDDLLSKLEKQKISTSDAPNQERTRRQVARN